MQGRRLYYRRSGCTTAAGRGARVVTSAAPRPRSGLDWQMPQSTYAAAQPKPHALGATDPEDALPSSTSTTKVHMTSHGHLRLAATVLIAVFAVWAHIAMATEPALRDHAQPPADSGMSLTADLSRSPLGAEPGRRLNSKHRDEQLFAGRERRCGNCAAAP